MSVIALRKYHVVIANDYWVDVSTGNWEADCNAGRKRADFLIDHMANCPEDRHAHFIRMMRTLVERGTMTGVEVGYFQRMLELAIDGRDAKK